MRLLHGVLAVDGRKDCARLLSGARHDPRFSAHAITFQQGSQGLNKNQGMTLEASLVLRPKEPGESHLIPLTGFVAEAWQLLLLGGERGRALPNAPEALRRDGETRALPKPSEACSAPCAV